MAHRDESFIEELSAPIAMCGGGTILLLMVGALVIFGISLFSKSPPWETADLDRLNTEVHQVHLLSSRLEKVQRNNPVRYSERYVGQSVIVEGKVRKIHENGLVEFDWPFYEMVLGRADSTLCSFAHEPDIARLSPGERVEVRGIISPNAGGSRQRDPYLRLTSCSLANGADGHRASVGDVPPESPDVFRKTGEGYVSIPISLPSLIQ